MIVGWYSLMVQHYPCLTAKTIRLCIHNLPPKKRTRFSVLKIWVLITLGSGAVLNYAVAPQEEAMPGIMAEPIVGNRPDRIEPRAVKRRAKAYPKLQHSRAKTRQLKRYQGKAA